MHACRKTTDKHPPQRLGRANDPQALGLGLEHADGPQLGRDFDEDGARLGRFKSSIGGGRGGAGRRFVGGELVFVVFPKGEGMVSVVGC